MSSYLPISYPTHPFWLISTGKTEKTELRLVWRTFGKFTDLHWCTLTWRSNATQNHNVKLALIWYRAVPCIMRSIPLCGTLSYHKYPQSIRTGAITGKAGENCGCYLSGAHSDCLYSSPNTRYWNKKLCF